MHAAERHRGRGCSAAFGRVCSHRGRTFAARSQSRLIVVVRIGERHVQQPDERGTTTPWKSQVSAQESLKSSADPKV